jgi:hypothetical protein
MLASKKFPRLCVVICSVICKLLWESWFALREGIDARSPKVFILLSESSCRGMPRYSGI